MIMCDRVTRVYGDWNVLRRVVRISVHAALRDLGFSGKGEMKTSSLGRTARLSGQRGRGPLSGHRFRRAASETG